MNIKDALLKEHSKKQCNAIIKFVGDDKKRFKVLLNLFLGKDVLVSQRAGWPLSYLSIANPKLILPHISKLISNLNKSGHHDAVLRNTIRIFYEIEIPTKYCAHVFDICFMYSKNPTLPLAVRVFSIYTMANICKKYPELKAELELILSELKSRPESPSIYACIRKVSKILLKL